MRRYRVEVIEPTSLLPVGCSAREAFDAVWPLIGVTSKDWHRSMKLDIDGGLFLKGMYIRPRLNPQHFLRRWHIRNELRNLIALRDLHLAKPVPVAWGCESRFGLPVRSFLVQRTIAGVDFSDYIRGDSEPKERLAVFCAVGETVRALHAAGWIHGDLACRNLLVLPETREVVLVDLARVKPVPPNRIGWRRRKELYRLVKSADKCGAASEEVERMLQAAAGEHAATIIQNTRALRTIDRRGTRKLHTWYWRITGRSLG